MGGYNLSYPVPADSVLLSIPDYRRARLEAPQTVRTRPTFYNFLRQQGMSDEWIERELRNILTEAGFTNSEINAYFARHKLPEGFDEYVRRGYLNPTADPEVNARLAEQARLLPGAGEHAALFDAVGEGFKQSLSGNIASKLRDEDSYIPTGRAVGPEARRLNWGGPVGRKARGVGAWTLFQATEPLPGPEPVLTPEEAFFRWLGGERSGPVPERVAAYLQYAANNPHVSQAVQDLLHTIQQYSDQVANEAAYPQVAPSPVPPVDQAQDREDGSPFMAGLSLEPATSGYPDPAHFIPRAFGDYGVKIQSKALKTRMERKTFPETEVPKTGLTLAERDSLPLPSRIAMHLASMAMDAWIPLIGARFLPIKPWLGAGLLTGGVDGGNDYHTEHGWPQNFSEAGDMGKAIALGASKGAATGQLGHMAGGGGRQIVANLGGNRTLQTLGASAAEGIARPIADGALHGRLPTDQYLGDSIYMALLTNGGAPLPTYARQNFNSNLPPLADEAVHDRLPTDQDFTDSIYTILLANGAKSALADGPQAFYSNMQLLDAKSRNIYELTGVPPWEVKVDALADPVFCRELLDKDLLLPNKYAEQFKQRILRGEKVPLSELAPFQDLDWVRAAKAEAAKQREIKRGLGRMYERMASEDFAPPPEGDGQAQGGSSVK